MTMAKVWNDNTYPFKQEFKGETIEIPPKSFIEMEYSEAMSFKSKPSPIVKDGMGQTVPATWKMIRVEGAPIQETVVAYRCHADGSLHPSREAMEAHAKQYEAQKIQPVDDKRGPGRPKKTSEEANV